MSLIALRPGNDVSARPQDGTRPVRVSIIIPIYNELHHAAEMLKRVAAASLPPECEKEVIIVDDGSTDGTAELLDSFRDSKFDYVHHSILNFGKGTAIRIGLRLATGDIVLMQDGDLEYDPNEYALLLRPILDGKADVVYGSRFRGRVDGMAIPNLLANKVLTFMANLLYGANITDEATAYKVFRRDVMDRIDLQCKRFEFCPEVTAKVRRLGYAIHEIPITYNGRTVEQGKKIRWADGLEAVYTLLRYRLTSPKGLKQVRAKPTSSSGEVTDSDSRVPEAPVQLGQTPRFVLWASFVAGWFWTLYLLWHSPGTFTQDEIGHFIIARDAWHTPSLIFNDWGRAVNTLIYMIPALFGLTAARVVATLIAAATVLFATKLAKKLGAEFYFAVPIVVWFQLWYCDFSHAAITEVPFALLMVLSTYFFVSGEFLAVSIAVGLLPYVRTEGIALALVWAAYCLSKKNWSAAIIALLPAALINLIARLFGAGHLGIYANAHPIGQLQMQLYGVGTWSHYPTVLINHVGLTIILLAVYALAAILKQSARLLVFAFYGLYMAIHMVIYHFGLYGGGGDVRYVFPLAPAIGVAAVFGLEYVASVFQSTGTRVYSFNEKQFRAVGVIALALIAAVGMRYQVRPLDPEAVDAKMTADWLREEKLTRHALIATHVYFYYYLPLRVPPKWDLWQHPEISTAKPGTIAIWDSHYSELFGLPSASLSPANGWELLREFDYPSTGTRPEVDGLPPARFLVFEKRSPESSRPESPASGPAGGKPSTGLRHS
jgi:dolichol-phosphate mannosyltransferase